MTADDATSDVELLMHTAGDLAVELVQKHGAFSPFAVTLGGATADIAIVHVDPSDSQDEPIDQLRRVVGTGAHADRYRGVAVVEDVQILEPTTGQQVRAVRMELEHKLRPPVTWYWPYEQIDGKWQFGGASGEGYLQEGERRLFARRP